VILATRSHASHATKPPDHNHKIGSDLPAHNGTYAPLTGPNVLPDMCVPRSVETTGEVNVAPLMGATFTPLTI
jgi:hypothetical protein